MRVRWIRLVLPLALAAVVGAGVAMAATTAPGSSGATVKTAASSTYGKVLVAANGKTLYRYTLDKKGKSVCSGACATYWPPLLLKGTAKATAGPGASAALLGEVMRANGAHQVTYAGYPLYFYAGDKKAGDTTGEGVQKVWYVVSPKGALVKAAAKKASTSSGGAAGWG